MLFTVVLVVSLVTASFFGHLIHWALHQPWSGAAHRAHLEHHQVLYPVGRLVSDKYVRPKWYHNGFVLYTPPFIVLMLVTVGLLRLCAAPLWIAAVFAASMLGMGLLNSTAHNSYHLRRYPLMRFRWYRRLKALHFLHHFDMNCNFGIVSLTWDAFFGTKATHR